MEFEEFIEVVKNEVQSRVGEDYNVTVNSILKVNRELYGIIIGLKNALVMNCIYLEEFYAEYLNGMSVDEITKEIIKLLQQNKLDLDQSSMDIYNYEWVKPRLRVKLINYIRNEKLLQTVPYEALLDLAIVPYVVISEGEKSATFIVRIEHIEHWNVRADELLSVAKENTLEKELVVIQRMSDFIHCKIFKEDGNGDYDIIDGKEGIPKLVVKSTLINSKDIYIITNSRNINGAFVAFQSNQLLKLAEIIGYDRLYLLPSSIHEILVFPAKDFPVNYLREIVRDVNRTMLSADEILSDEVYLFERFREKNNISLTSMLDICY